jgi:hypothetical protein
MNDDIQAPATPSIEQITNGHAAFYVLLVEDDKSDGTGNSIIWEHPVPMSVSFEKVPMSVSFEKVLAMRDNLGDRYGRTWIAQCYVMPSTERVPGLISADQVAYAAQRLTGESEDGVIPLVLRWEALQMIRRFLKQQTEVNP